MPVALAFRDDVAHVARCQELALLDVHRQALGADVLNEVGLAAEEGRRLQDGHHVRDLAQGGVLVHVGQHGHADLAPDALENAQALLDADAPEAQVRRAVGLVERTLVDERHADVVGDSLERRRRLEGEFLRLDDTRTRDEEDGTVKTDLEGVYLHGRLPCRRSTRVFSRRPPVPAARPAASCVRHRPVAHVAHRRARWRRR